MEPISAKAYVRAAPDAAVAANAFRHAQVVVRIHDRQKRLHWLLFCLREPYIKNRWALELHVARFVLLHGDLPPRAPGYALRGRRAAVHRARAACLRLSR